MFPQRSCSSSIGCPRIRQHGFFDFFWPKINIKIELKISNENQYRSPKLVENAIAMTKHYPECFSVHDPSLSSANLLMKGHPIHAVRWWGGARLGDKFAVHFLLPSQKALRTLIAFPYSNTKRKKEISGDWVRVWGEDFKARQQ